ncbi:MAG TPA: NYN domain-containing protein [Cellulomonas sp.]
MSAADPCDQHPDGAAPAPDVPDASVAPVASAGAGSAAGVPVVVPGPVRDAVVQLAAEVLGALEPALVPAALAAVRRFAPRRRASAGAGPLWAAVERDDAFRARVARAWSEAHPLDAGALVAGRASGTPQAGSASPDAAVPDALMPDASAPGEAAPVDSVADDVVPVDPVLRAAGAVLLRPEGWTELVLAATAAVPDDPTSSVAPSTSISTSTPSPGTTTAPGDGADEAARRAARAEAEVHRLAARLTAETERAERAVAEVATLRKEQRRLRADADRARSEARRSAEHAQDVAAAAERVHAESARARAEADRDRRRADDLVAAARADASALRELAEVRVRLLLDTIVDAGSALRTELALPPAGRAPADLVARPDAVAAVRATSRGRAAEDPAFLDELLALPRVHLVVDGYNVTKRAWEDRSLAEQRRRLTEHLANLAARTGAEVTCCFDGVDQQQGRAPAGPRGLRVLFSSGEIADDLIRRIVAAEPRGRVVVVVTGDQALARDVEAAGARVVPSATLIARLARV